MTGGSLGIRSSLSYGSLQLYNNLPALLPNNSTQGSTAPSNRKVNSKMLFVGSREKERRLNSVGKVGSRRKIGMLLLFVASAAVFLSFFFALSRDVEQQPVGPEAVVGYSDHIWNLVHRGISSNNISPPSKFSEDVINTTTLVSNTRNHNINNDTVLSPIVHSIKVPSQHPCQNFSLPPPIVDPKRTGPRPCDVCYVPEDIAMGYMPAFPSISPVLRNLDFVTEKNLLENESNGGSSFGGHPSLVQREKSYDIKESMTVYCGFANGKKLGLGTSFDMEEADLFEMEQCRGVVVASAIFGNYDIMQQPKNISVLSRSTVCFYMFVDQETEASIKNSSVIDSGNKVGLWRVVAVRNLPYADARRNGKVPKLLLHRIFPNARYSLWIDGKLELVVDPYQILERFLWRNNATFAISRHYRRFDVFEEAKANKAAGKYDNASIDNQVDFYRKEGLTHFSPAKYPITSDVPEGCVIIREHIPITNLFTCLWFNEVDRFTSRDQLSFSTVRDKIMSRVNWTVNMFLDCERRNFVVQGYHRDILEQKLASQKLRSGKASQSKPRTNSVLDPSKENSSERRKSTFDVMVDVSTTKPSQSRRQSSRRGKDRKSGSRRHRLKGAAAIAREINLF